MRWTLILGTEIIQILGSIVFFVIVCGGYISLRGRVSNLGFCLWAFFKDTHSIYGFIRSRSTYSWWSDQLTAGGQHVTFTCRRIYTKSIHVIFFIQICTCYDISFFFWMSVSLSLAVFHEFNFIWCSYN